MKTYKLLTGITLALAPGAALATTSGDEDCAAACTSNDTAVSCCLAETVAVAEAPVALASAAVACERGMMGVYLADTDGAAVVEGLVEGGPAAKAGLKAGDRILAVGDKKVKNWNQLTEWMASRQAGERLSVTVERDGWKKAVELTLAPAPEPPAGAGSNAAAAPSNDFFISGQRGPNAADAPSSGFFFDAKDGPMTLELLGDHDEEGHHHAGDGDHEHEHEHEHEHGDGDGGHPQVFTLQGGGGHAMVLGGDGGKWVTKVTPHEGHEIDLTDVTHGISHGDAHGNVMIKVIKSGETVDLDCDVDLTDVTHGMHEFHFGGGEGEVEGHANVIIKAMKDGKVVDVKDLDIDLSDLHMDLSQLHHGLDLEGLELQGLDLEELHESLGQLHGLHVNVTKGIGSESCCEGDGECCEGEAKANVFHVLGGQSKGQSKGQAKGIVVQRMGGGEGEGPHQLRWVDDSGDVLLHVNEGDDHKTLRWATVEGQPNVTFGLSDDGGHGMESHGDHGDLRQRIRFEGGHETGEGRVLLFPKFDNQLGKQEEAQQRVRVGRRMAAPAPPRRGGDADLDELRQELQALRAELRELRQSLRRIKAGAR